MAVSAAVPSLFDALGLPRPAGPFVLVEDRLDRAAPARLYAGPAEIVRCDDPDSVAEALARIEAGRAQALHAAGFFAYELGYVFEPRLVPLMPAERPAPLIWFGLFPPPRLLPAAAVDAAFAALGPPPPIAGLMPADDRAAHRARVQRVLGHIAAGDTYQVNLTFPLRFRYGGDPAALYSALRAAQPAAHGALVVTDDFQVLSVSPELFVSVADGRAVTRPMKGTAARGADATFDGAADRAAAEALAADPKQRAENLMIVDLLRNDLGRIAEAGSVAVPDLFTVETYPSLHTMTSTVTATLRPGVDLAQAMAALFPCGSVVGAPKHRAMELIRAIEPAARGIYTGAVGTAAPDGAFAFNVAIRTAWLDAEGRGHYGVGGGIVADSDPDAEYDEALLKGRVLTDLARDYGLIETLRWRPGEGLVRGARHLARLAASARQLGFAFDAEVVAAELARFTDALDPAPGDRRLRLELARDGSVAITAAPLGPEPGPDAPPLRVGVATARIDAGDPFLRHKTTRRALFEQAFAAAAAAGVDEAVLLNRDGRVTEATRQSVLLRRNGTLLTPPLTEGLLPGVLRQELLDEGAAVEAPLTLGDLRAGEWYLGNSLRGLRRAMLVS